MEADQLENEEADRAIQFPPSSRKWAISAFVHPCAQVDHECEIGKRTRVWQFASVIRHAKLGDDCSVATCSIVDGSRLGDRVIVSHGAFVDPGIEIGNDVFVGPGVKFCNDIWPRFSKEGWFDIVDLITGKIVVTRVEDGASIGAGAIIMPGITVGRGAMVAAGAVVAFDVKPGHLYKPDMYHSARAYVQQQIRTDQPGRKRHL